MSYKYVVRGALVQCNQGSKQSKLNLPKSHGVYVNERPVLIDKDSVANVNVMPFGKCRICGECKPFLAPLWDTAKGDTLIQGGQALLDISVLSCAAGGIITIKHHGQLC